MTPEGQDPKQNEASDNLVNQLARLEENQKKILDSIGARRINIATVAFFFAVAALLVNAFIGYYYTARIETANLQYSKRVDTANARYAAEVTKQNTKYLGQIRKEIAQHTARYDYIKVLLEDQRQNLAEVQSRMALSKDVWNFLLANHETIYGDKAADCERIKDILVTTGDGTSLELLTDLEGRARSPECRRIYATGRKAVEKTVGIKIRIYFRPHQSREATRLQSVLEKEYTAIPGCVEKCELPPEDKAITPPKTEVRYFFGWDARQAQSIATRLRSGGQVLAVNTSRVPDRQMVPPRTFEIWVGQK